MGPFDRLSELELHEALARRRGVFGAALVALAVLSDSASAQASLHVPADYPTIQAAIDAAQSGDQVLVAEGTYGPIDFRGKAITVQAVPLGGASIVSALTTAVRFINGEGVDSRLIGFGISGRVNDTPSGGIYCEVGPRTATPYIADCVIGNCGMEAYTVAEGVGVHGNPILERCTIRNNHGETFSIVGSSFGGGVHGAPTMRACRIESNSAMSGGGLVLLDGARLEDCAIVGNEALVGASQYGPIVSYGGGILCGSNVVLVRCLIARNAMWGYTDIDGFQYGFGAAIAGGPTLIDCTIVDNVLYDGEVGGIYGGGNLTGCILRDNAGAQGGSTFRYCNAPGPPPGEGNFDADPRFVNRSVYALHPDSPCIDAGDPATSDPDGTRADVGARWFNQRPGEARVRVGAGLNPLALTSNSLPILGQVWSTNVQDPRPIQSLRIALLQGNLAPGSTRYPFGEVLLDLHSPIVLARFQVLLRGETTFSFDIPKHSELLGRGLSLQAAVVGGGFVLSNAVDLVVGVPGDSLP